MGKKTKSKLDRVFWKIKPMKLFLDDYRNPSDVGLDNEEWIVVRRFDDIQTILMCCYDMVREKSYVKEISLDHDLGEINGDTRTGYDLVKWMVDRNIWPTDNIYIHSANPVGRANMKAMVDRYFYKKEEVR